MISMDHSTIIWKLPSNTREGTGEVCSVSKETVQVLQKEVSVSKNAGTGSMQDGDSGQFYMMANNFSVFVD